MKTKNHRGIGISIKLFSLFLCLFFAELIPASNYVINNSKMSVTISATGEISSITTKNGTLITPISLNSGLDGCTLSGSTIVRENTDGSIEFEKLLVNDSLNTTCTLIQRYYSTLNSIRCDLSIRGGGNSWSVPINTTLKYPLGNNNQIRYWTAWGSPNIDTLSLDAKLKKSLREIKGGCAAAAGWSVLGGEKNNRWVDPLIPVPFTNGKYYYGAASSQYSDPMAGYVPAQNDLFAIPMATVVDESKDFGLTLALSPEDKLIDLELQTAVDGSISLRRLYNRISSGNVVKFSFDIITHEGDWRPAISWLKDRYSGYFLPKNPIAQQMGGTGSYSASTELGDVDKLKEMDYSVNWQASFDFPYMGMFIPPVTVNDSWTSYGGSTTSIPKMNNIAKTYKDNGFYSLSYFNVTEFGTGILCPQPARTITNDVDLWKNSNDYLYTKLPGAILPTPENKITDPKFKNVSFPVPIGTWGGAAVTDCGDSVYAGFLVNQAQKHIEYIPDSYGICIDRLDWLRMFNEKANDGITWHEGKPVRSLINSWKHLLDTIGPIMHNANKVIFVNNHTRRIDLLNHVDGIFDEFTYMGNSLNLMALTSYSKPALGWVDVAATIENEGGDSFFQKYLYMGVFPMCPFSGNDHALYSTPYVDKYYFDYGFLLKMMKGREWILKPHLVKVENESAKANVFKIKNGYMIPVVYGLDSVINLTLNGLEVKQKCYVYYPGKPVPMIIESKSVGDSIKLSVPLERGCAVLCFLDKTTLTLPEAFNKTLTTKVNSNLGFNYTSFSSNFSFPLESIKIVTLPSNGNLKLLNTTVSVGDIITAQQLKDLQYVPTVNYIGNDQFTWKGISNNIESNTAEMAIQIQIKKVFALDIAKKKITCNSLSNFYSKTANLIVDASNSSILDGFTRITRSTNTEETLVIKSDEDIRYFDALVFGYGSAEKILKFYVSPNAKTWTEVTVNSGSGLETVRNVGWFRKHCVPTMDIGTGARYLKIVFVVTGVSWGTQLAEISIGKMNAFQRNYINAPLNLPSVANLYIDDATTEQLSLSWDNGQPSFNASAFGVYQFNSTVVLPQVGYGYTGSLAVSYTDSIIDITKGVAPLLGIDDFMGRDASGNILYTDGTVAATLIANWNTNKAVKLGITKYLSVNNVVDNGYSAIPGWKINEGLQGRYAHIQRGTASDSYIEYVVIDKSNLEFELLTNIFTNISSAIDVKVTSNGLDWNSVVVNLLNTGITSGAGYYTLFKANIPLLPLGSKIVRIYLKNGLDNLPPWAPQLLAVSSKAYPVINWSNPADISYGNILTAKELNATADIPGTFNYTPALNTLLQIGAHDLKVDFTPTDLTKFLPVSKTVQLIVADPTALNNIDNKNAILYPNPFDNSIHLAGSESVNKVSVYSTTGMLVYTSTPNKTNFELDLSVLKSGVYKIDLLINKSTKSYKLLKK